MIVKNKGSWCEKHNQYARTKLDCPHCELDELRERHEALIEACHGLLGAYRNGEFQPSTRFPDVVRESADRVAQAARKAVEELL